MPVLNGIYHPAPYLVPSHKFWKDTKAFPSKRLKAEHKSISFETTPGPDPSPSLFICNHLRTPAKGLTFQIVLEKSRHNKRVIDISRSNETGNIRQRPRNDFDILLFI